MERTNGKLRPLMLVGTGSDVGKSVLAAAFCRIFRQDGYRPAPFKAQNMALNSYATPEGFEIGRAQAVQAEAAGVPCHTDMNPLLLKPCTDSDAQVVLNGVPVGTKSASDFFRKRGREALRRTVCEAFDRLEARYNPVVMEGAGSISEINLRELDIVNMPMALHAGADVLLVADIDRGGVFGSVYGSLMLLPEPQLERVKGILVNKFRGDRALFDDGVRMMEELCGIPVLGVVPYFRDIHVEAEDSLVLEGKSREAERGKVSVAVVLLRHLSNFTDFDVLERDPRVRLFYTDRPEEIASADIVVLPGTKSTVDDLRRLRSDGTAAAVLGAHRAGRTVVGVCGGYQMMGRAILDPFGVESDTKRMPGLGLLPVETTLRREKRTRQVRFTLDGDDAPCRGYEIHMGETVPVPGAGLSPLNRYEDGTGEGYRLDGRCMGTYVHGIFDNPAFVDMLLAPYAQRAAVPFDYRAYKEEQYDRLADHVRRHVDMERIYEMLSRP